MRIAVNTRVLLKGRMEGVARYIYHTTKEMVLAHPEDDFYFFFDRPYDKSFVFAENVHPVKIGFPARHPILFILWFEFAFYNAIKKFNIDVVYSGDSYMSLRSNVPTVLVSHDLAYVHYPDHIPLLNRWYYKYYFPRFHKKANKIIAVSKATRQDIMVQYNLSSDKIDIAYNDTDGSFIPLSDQQKMEVRKEYSKGKPYFLYLGSIHPRKNIINILKAFNHFKSEYKTDHQLILVGRKAWNNQELSVAYNKADFKSEIHFLGMLDQGRERLVGAAEALLYVSLFEGFGVPILEAMDARTAVICSNVSSMPEVGGEAAIQVDPTSFEDISEAMHYVSKDISNKVPYLEAMEQQREKFNWEESGKIIYNALENAMRK